MGAFVADFGKDKDGLNLFRINGTKDDIKNSIQKLKDVGCEIWDDPYEIEKAHKCYSVLIKIKIPEIPEVENEK